MADARFSEQAKQTLDLLIACDACSHPQTFHFERGEHTPVDLNSSWEPGCRVRNQAETGVCSCRQIFAGNRVASDELIDPKDGVLRGY